MMLTPIASTGAKPMGFSLMGKTRMAAPLEVADDVEPELVPLLTLVVLPVTLVVLPVAVPVDVTVVLPVAVLAPLVVLTEPPSA